MKVSYRPLVHAGVGSMPLTSFSPAVKIALEALIPALDVTKDPPEDDADWNETDSDRRL